jgi:hypothetical protein
MGKPKADNELAKTFKTHSDASRMKKEYKTMFKEDFCSKKVDAFIKTFAAEVQTPPEGGAMAGGIEARRYRTLMRHHLVATNQHRLKVDLCIRQRQLQSCRHAVSTKAKKTTCIDLQKARIAAQAKFIRTQASTIAAQKTELLELHAIVNIMVMSKHP